jgi:hypothetical protein
MPLKTGLNSRSKLFKINHMKKCAICNAKPAYWSKDYDNYLCRDHQVKVVKGKMIVLKALLAISLLTCIALICTGVITFQ